MFYDPTSRVCGLNKDSTMNSNSVRDGQPQHSNQPSKSPSYDLQAIKRQVGLAPFAQRVH